jgi:hypothetical protein
MTLENMFYISQTVAAFALVESLLFLGLEVRHRNLERRHRSSEDSLQKLRDVELHMCGDADRARVWLSGLRDYAGRFWSNRFAGECSGAGNADVRHEGTCRPIPAGGALVFQ